MIGKPLLDTRDGFTRIQMFGADFGAVHDGVTAIQLKCIVQLSKAFRSRSIATILDPSIR
jgi:hypothetical protein